MSLSRGRAAGRLNSGVRHQPIMIGIRADGDDIEISGTAAELREISTIIEALISSDELSATVLGRTIDPAPYARSVGSLKIQRTAGRTRVSETDSQVLVTGSDDSLARFASWFEFPPHSKSGNHSHFEPLADDPYHSPDSNSLVVSVS